MKKAIQLRFLESEWGARRDERAGCLEARAPGQAGDQLHEDGVDLVDEDAVALKREHRKFPREDGNGQSSLLVPDKLKKEVNGNVWKHGGEAKDRSVGT